jgi:hypothetical protein
MISRIFLQFVLLRAVLSMSLPSTVKVRQRQLVGTVGFVIATTIPLSAQALEVIKIDADIPALIQIAKDNKDIALKLAQQTASAVKITDYPKSYLNLFNFARDAAAGDIFAQINGLPIDVSLLSEKGAIDVGVSTELGDISLTVTSKFLPKLPFLSKRVTPLSTAVDDNSVEPSMVDKKVKSESKGSVMERPFFFGPFHQGWSVQQVLGTTSLGLGIAYASSYAYYIKSIEDEEKVIAEKKKVATTKATQAASKVEKNTVMTKKATDVLDTKATTPAASKVLPESKAKESSKAKSTGIWRFWKKK